MWRRDCSSSLKSGLMIMLVMAQATTMLVTKLAMLRWTGKFFLVIYCNFFSTFLVLPPFSSPVQVLFSLPSNLKASIISVPGKTTQNLVGSALMIHYRCFLFYGFLILGYPKILGLAGWQKIPVPMQKLSRYSHM